MSVPIKIKTLLTAKGKKQSEYAEKLGMAAQSLQNKFTRKSFFIKDLILLGDLTGTHLSFIDENNNPVIIFDIEDAVDLPDQKKRKN